MGRSTRRYDLCLHGGRFFPRSRETPASYSTSGGSPSAYRRATVLQNSLSRDKAPALFGPRLQVPNRRETQRSSGCPIPDTLQRLDLNLAYDGGIRGSVGNLAPHGCPSDRPK